MVDFGALKDAISGDKSMKLKALIFYPNKSVVMKNISAKDKRFDIGKNAYIVDEKAIYYFKKMPLLVYHFDCPSPIIVRINDMDSEVVASMDSQEIKNVLDSDLAKDLLTAVGEDNLILYIAGAAALLSLVNTLFLTGVIKIGG